MPEWKTLEKDLSRWMQSLATSDELMFRNCNQAIAGFPFDGFRSDGMITDGKTLVAIEVEAGQMHPDTNVGKYWLLYDEYKKYKKIILFHIYTPDYSSYGWRKELAEFYAEKMKAEIPIDYVLMDFRGSENYSTTINIIKSKIRERIRLEFNMTA